MRHPLARGFTLIELLVVIAIIGVLSTLAVVAMNGARNAAKTAKAQHDIDALVLALKQLESDCNEWPLHQVVEQVSVVDPNEVWDLNDPEAGLVATDGLFPNWHGPYMTVVRPDPWGHDYFYDSDYQINGEGRVVIGSFGPNGVGQNVYDADNIIKILH